MEPPAIPRLSPTVSLLDSLIITAVTGASISASLAVVLSCPPVSSALMGGGGNVVVSMTGETRSLALSQVSFPEKSNNNIIIIDCRSNIQLFLTAWHLSFYVGENGTMRNLPVL